VKAFKTVHNDLVIAGLRPQLQRLDNECFTIIQEYLVQQDFSFQLVPPGIHQIWPNERYIPSRTTSLLVSVAPIQTFPSIYGTDYSLNPFSR
jgi:hypothetical protein